MTKRGSSVGSRRTVWLVALALVSMITGAGCSSASKALSSAGTTASTAPGAMTNLGTVTIATSFAIHTLDPIDNGFWGSEFGFGDLLMRPIGHNDLEPWLLQSLTQSAPTVWTLELRPNIKFQNGDPL